MHANAPQRKRERVSEKVEVKVEGRPLRLSNLDKPLYPDGTTKAGVVDYYRRIAPVLLPHLKGRPVTLKRYPNGVEGDHFYQKECPAHRPDWLHTGEVPSRHRDKITYCLLDDLPSLLWAANLANLELHTFLHRVEDLERPTMVAFDLDPGAPAGVLESAAAALRLREVLEASGLSSYPKTSGSKGLHVYVPLNTPTDHEETKSFARAVARVMERADPKGFTSNMKKSERPGKIFVDWSQNDAHKTTVCAYSLRARERPTVSTPLRWEEVEQAVEEGDPDLLTFTAADVLERVREHGDLFGPVLTERQTLPSS